MNKFEKPILILGAGSWGTALALHLSRLGQTVYLWSNEINRIIDMEKDGVNKRYLPNHPFPATLIPNHDLASALQICDDLLIAVPSSGFRDLLITIKPQLKVTSRIIGVTKGLDENTGALLHDTLRDILGNHYPYAVLSGPSFAGEVAAGLPTAVVVASDQKTFAEDVAKRFSSPVFRVYLSNDVIGVEVGGAVKNVMAIATGISDGMGFGANARCALITRGLAEITRLGIALNADPETLTGLAGLGDLILTCTDNQSRNRRFGLSISQGTQANDAAKEIGQVVEGKRNAELVVKLAHRVQIEMPIAEAVYRILEGKITPFDAMRELLARATKPEH
jgi:glycerol-3-phosphate dehydrogenase (NAD(P)+)